MFREAPSLFQTVRRSFVYDAREEKLKDDECVKVQIFDGVDVSVDMERTRGSLSSAESGKRTGNASS